MTLAFIREESKFILVAAFKLMMSLTSMKIVFALKLIISEVKLVVSGVWMMVFVFDSFLQIRVVCLPSRWISCVCLDSLSV